ncbi:KRAB-A domain-containing protein 2-like [Acropora muricata]|uniref:KRAB-A domain-containing protein 2-like n=1 Tax=Acropora muricata TaxID=159855 RepID=UPI0034E61D09
MKTPVLLLLLSLVIFDLSSAGKENKRQTRPLDDVSYETIFSLCEGTFNIPVLARTRTQKSACIRFWRNKKYFSVRKINGKKVLCFRGKEVLKMSEFEKVIESEFLHCKGVGSRKLKQRLATRYESVSEPRVQKILSKSSLNQMVNAKFGNKAISRPIRASGVQVRHQIDLVDMSKLPVLVNGQTLKYILTVQDVFSRFLWLRALSSKVSKEVASALADLYMEVGPPKVLQADNGGEFKKAVQKLCEKLAVKIVRGSPYHPQSQGKVERSHRALRKKISFDMAHLNKNGVNWAIQLKEYQKLQNEESMEALGRQSPFQVFYGRESNAVKNFAPGGRCVCENGKSSRTPTKKDFTTTATSATKCAIRLK